MKNLQNLIDAIYEIGLHSKHFKGSREDHIKWMTKQLTDMGYPTIPLGALHGKLTENTFTFNISDKGLSLIKYIKSNGYAEYRDTRYANLKEFQENDTSGKTDDYFLNRNSNGTYEDIDELIELNLVEHDDDSWHTTYKLSQRGKNIAELIK